MRLVSLPVNKQVVSLQAGDFNGDGRADLVFYGTPSGIEIHFNKGNGRFGDIRKVNVGEAIEAPSALSVEDFDGDGRDDLVLLMKDEIVLIAQPEKGKLGEPERPPARPGQPADGQADRPRRQRDARPGDAQRRVGGFRSGRGSRRARGLSVPRSAWRSRRSGRMPSATSTASRATSWGSSSSSRGGSGSWRSASATTTTRRRAAPAFYPLPPGGNTAGRSIDTGDLDGDGSVEVVATDPSKAQVFVYRRAGGAGLGSSRTFPGLLGGGPVRVVDTDGDKKAEVFVLAEKEKQIARSTLLNGRLSFPASLPTEGDPVAMEVADIDGDKKPEVVYVTRGKADGSTADLFTLRALKLDDGKFVKTPMKVEIKGIGGVPPRLVVADINRDEQPDIVVFDPFGPPVLLMGRKGESPAPASGGLGPLADVAAPALTVADLDGPSLLVAQQGFARKIRRDGDGQWSVTEQFDAGRPDAQIQAAAVLDTDGDGTKEIALLDRPSKSVIFLAKKDGIYKPAGRIVVGTFDDFERLIVADLDGDKTDDLLLAGTTRFTVIATGQAGRKFHTIASYESNRNEARLGDLAIGDLNADGHADVVLTDIGEHFIEIATYEPGQSDLTRAASFKVFEKKGGGRRSMSDMVEPRDMTLGDVDGDRRTDLVLTVHDRILVYRQDPGPDAGREKARNDDKPKTDKDAVKAAADAQ